MPYKDKTVAKQWAHERYLRNKEAVLQKQKEYAEGRGIEWRRKVGRDYYYRHKTKIRAKHNTPENRLKARLKKYGLTLKEFEQILITVESKCEICRRFLEWDEIAIDHNHDSNKFRGILCKACNLLIGHAYENLEILLSAINYLSQRGSKILLRTE